MSKRRREVVTCFLRHRGRVLALKRSQKVRTHRGKWAGISGSIDAGTPLQQALLEIKEETGLGGDEVELVHRGEPLDIADPEHDVEWRVHPFLFEISDPSRIRLDWEHTELRWIDPSRLSELETVPKLKETWERLSRLEPYDTGNAPAEDEIGLRIAAIEQDREHGATFLAMEAVRVMARATAACDSGPEWAGCLTSVAGRLAAAKPAMAAVRNVTDFMLERLLSLGSVEARLQTAALAEEMLTRLAAAAEGAAANAALLLPQTATVVTCSFSSAIVRTLLKARQSGKTLHVMVMEASVRPESPGRHLAEELEGAGITAEVFHPDASADIVTQANIAIIGADAVTTAFVVNGAPSQLLAEAVSGGAPLYIVCETIKFIPDIAIEPGYDRVPLHLVERVVTEKGVLTPADVGRYTI